MSDIDYKGVALVAALLAIIFVSAVATVKSSNDRRRERHEHHVAFLRDCGKDYPTWRCEILYQSAMHGRGEPPL